VSCSDDGDEASSSPIGSQVFTRKRLSKIICSEKDRWFYEFIYENGRLTRFTEYYDGYVNDGYDYIIKYNKNKVTIALTGMYKNETVFTLNAKNFAVSCSGSHNYDFKYNEADQLIAYGNCRFEYENGNMVKSYFYDTSVFEYEETPVFYVYDNKENINGITPGDWLTVYDGIRDKGASGGENDWHYNDYDVLLVAYYAGILGKPTRNVPLKSYRENSKYYNFYPVYDNEGNVVNYKRNSYVYQDLNSTQL